MLKCHLRVNILTAKKKILFVRFIKRFWVLYAGMSFIMIIISLYIVLFKTSSPTRELIFRLSKTKNE